MAELNRFPCAYRIDPKAPRGFCVVLDILNNSTAIRGDIVAIKKTFTELDFIVKIHENLTAKQLVAEARKYYTMDHTNFYCFFGIVLSATNEAGEICDANGEVIKVESLLEGFCANETLKGKPKVFLFQKTVMTDDPNTVLLPDVPRLRQDHIADPSDLFVYRFIVISLWISFFDEYKKVATDSKFMHWPLYAIVEEVKKNINNFLIFTELQIPEFNPDCFDSLSHDLHLPYKGVQVNQKQVNDKSLVNDPHSEYPLMKVINGYCIIINNLGSDFVNDCLQLGEVFRNELDFHVESFVLLSSQAIDELLKTLTKIDHSQFNSLAVILYGEGDHQTIKGCGDKGEPLEMADIENNFTYENCPTLSSKPKLFIYNLKKATIKRKRTSRDSERKRLCHAGSSSADDQQPSVIEIPDVFRIFNLIEVTADSGDEDRFASAFTNALRSNDSCNTLDSIAAACLRDGLIRPTIGRTMKLTSGRASTKPDNADSLRQAKLAADLKMVYLVWKIIRSRTIEQISENIDKLAVLAKDVRISQIAGASAGVVGGAIAVAGFVLLPFTFGGSVAVSAAGVGLATVGGLTSIGATIAQKIVENKELKIVNNLLSIDHQLSKTMDFLIEILQNEAKRYSNPSTPMGVWLSIMLKSADGVLKFGSVGARGAVIGLRAAGIGTLKGGAIIARLGTAGAAMGFAVVGGALNVALLPISIIELSINIYRLAKEKNTKTMQVLKDLIKKLHESLDDAEMFIERNNTYDQLEPLLTALCLGKPPNSDKLSAGQS